MGEQREKKVTEEDVLAQAEEQLKMVSDAKKKSEKAEEKKDGTKIAKSVKSQKNSKEKKRSQKYQEVKKLVDANKFYNLTDAVELAQKTSYTKFPGSIELHIKLIIKKGVKKIEPVRGLIEMPHATGKKISVGIIDETMSEEIIKAKKTDFDILLAKPEIMPKIARLAKILGPIGEMPNPKAGTVTVDPEATKKEIEDGRIEYKSDKYGIIHLMVGKTNNKKEDIVENIEALFTKIGKEKLQKVTLCATMGPSIKLEIK